MLIKRNVRPAKAIMLSVSRLLVDHPSSLFTTKHRDGVHQTAFHRQLTARSHLGDFRLTKDNVLLDFREETLLTCQDGRVPFEARKLDWTMVEFPNSILGSLNSINILFNSDVVPLTEDRLKRQLAVMTMEAKAQAHREVTKHVGLVEPKHVVLLGTEDTLELAVGHVDNNRVHAKNMAVDQRTLGNRLKGVRGGEHRLCHAHIITHIQTMSRRLFGKTFSSGKSRADFAALKIIMVRCSVALSGVMSLYSAPLYP